MHRQVDTLATGILPCAEYEVKDLAPICQITYHKPANHKVWRRQIYSFVEQPYVFSEHSDLSESRFDPTCGFTCRQYGCKTSETELLARRPVENCRHKSDED